MSLVDMKVERCDKYISDEGRRLSVDEWIEMLELLIDRVKAMRDAAVATL